jgi:hypothetical protein
MDPSVPFFWCLRECGTHLWEITVDPIGHHEHVWNAPHWMRHFGTCRFFTWDGSSLREHDCDASEMGERLRDMAHARRKREAGQPTAEAAQ